MRRQNPGKPEELRSRKSQQKQQAEQQARREAFYSHFIGFPLKSLKSQVVPSSTNTSGHLPAIRPARVDSLIKRIMASVIIMALMGSVAFSPITAEAKKKKKDDGAEKAAAAEAEMKKTLEPMAKTLMELLIKVQSRLLFSPKDSGKLAEIKFQLMELMKNNPKNELLVQPVYQAGVLFNAREQYQDAYELFGFLTANFPENAYGLRAKSEMNQLSKRFGENYFPPVAVVAPAAAADSAAGSAAPSTGTPATSAGAAPPATK